MEKKIIKKRIKLLRKYLKFLEKNPDSWNVLRRGCIRNVSEYSDILNTYYSIFNHIPNELVKAKNLSSHIKRWKIFKTEWYKNLASHYEDSWIPISDFESGEDEMFVDISDEGLPILITKFMGKDDFRKEKACDSLVVFMEIEKHFRTHSENSTIIQRLLKIFVVIIALPLFPFYLPFYFYKSYKYKKERKVWEEENGYVNGEKRYLVWGDIPGAGTLICKDCGNRVDVTGFTHGAYSCRMGVQCQHCGTFFTEYNESKKYHNLGPRTEDVACPNCGQVYKSKDEPISLNRKEFLFCPKCRSKNLKYHMDYIT